MSESDVLGGATGTVADQGDGAALPSDRSSICKVFISARTGSKARGLISLYAGHIDKRSNIPIQALRACMILA